MLTRNHVCLWNNNVENLPQSQHRESFIVLKSLVNFHPQCTPWKFYCVKVIGEFSPAVYAMKVLLCQSHRWIFTRSVRHESFTVLRSLVNFHPQCAPWKFYCVKVICDCSPAVYTVKVGHESFTVLKSSVNFHPQCTPWKFQHVKAMGKVSLTVYVV